MGYYNVGRSKKLWKRVFAYHLEVSILNAYIFQKTSNMCGKEQDYLNFRQGLAVELVGTSRRSQGGRPRAFEHSQLLRLDNSQSHLPECVTLKRDCIVCSDVGRKTGLLRQNTDMRAASNVVHVTCISVLVKVETATKSII